MKEQLKPRTKEADKDLALILNNSFASVEISIIWQLCSPRLQNKIERKANFYYISHHRQGCYCLVHFIYEKTAIKPPDKTERQVSF